MNRIKLFALCILCAVFAEQAFAQDERESLLKELDKSISESASYDALKHESI